MKLRSRQRTFIIGVVLIVLIIAVALGSQMAFNNNALVLSNLIKYTGTHVKDYKDATIFHDENAVKEVQKLVGRDNPLTEIQKHIIKLEGYSPDKYYLNPEEKKAGIVTTGSGQTREFANKPFVEVFAAKENKARDVFPDYDIYPLATQKALMSGIYRGDFQKGYTTVEAINAGDFTKASQHFLLKGNPATDTDWSISYQKALDNTQLAGVKTRLENIQGALEAHGEAQAQVAELNLNKGGYNAGVNLVDIGVKDKIKE